MKVEEISKTVTEEIANMISTKTVIGEHITMEGRTIIPATKVNFGFGSGGGEGKDKTGQELKMRCNIVLMRKALPLMMIALVGLMSADIVLGADSELVVNGGFEIGDFTGWTTAGSPEIVQSNDAHSGKYYARLDNDDSIQQIFSSATTVTGPLSLWARCEYSSCSLVVFKIYTTAGYRITFPLKTTWEQYVIPIDNAENLEKIILSTSDENGNIFPEPKFLDDVSITVYIQDYTPPTIGAVSPTTVEVNKLTTFSASYSDNVAVVSCDFFADGTNQGAMALPGGTSGTATKSYAFTAGTHTTQIKCKDAANNEGIGSLTSINVFDFGISTTPLSQVVNPGGKVLFKVSAILVEGNSQNVDLSVTVSDPSITATIIPSTIFPTNTGTEATLYLWTGQDTPTGTYDMTITGTSGTLVKTSKVSLIVAGNPIPKPPIAKKDFSVNLVTGIPSTNEIQIPETGSFNVVLKGGSDYSINDNDATDGKAEIQLIENRYYKIYGRLTGGDKNAALTVFSPFISGILMPQTMTLQKTAPPTTIDLTLLSPYMLQIPAPTSIVDTSKQWVTQYYPSLGLLID
jgi:hypothetical protein